MRQLLALLLGSLALAACQGSRIIYPSGLYRTAADFRQQLTPVGNEASRVFLDHEAYVKTGPGERYRVSLDSFWGYKGADRMAYRVYQNQAYEVEQTDTLVIYSVLVNVSKGTYRKYYFSNGLNGPVEYLAKRRLQRAFAGNPAFMALLRQLPWYQINALVSVPTAVRGYRVTAGYQVVALYRQALGLPAPQRH